MGWLGHRRGGVRRQFGWWASNGEETWRTVADDDRVDGQSRARERADERDRVVSGRAGARKKGMARLTGGVGWSVGERWAWKVGRVGRAGEEARARERGGGLGSGPAELRGEFPFSFSFSISFLFPFP
jgi:hypothetical protein